MLPDRLRACLIVLGTLAAGPEAGRGQDGPLRLQGLVPSGARTTLTGDWGTLQFSVANPASEGRDARVVVLFPDQPAVQYGRDVWVPARSVLTAWLPVGPPPKSAAGESIELQSLLYDRTGGRQTLLLPPGEGERVRSRLVRYRPRRPTTTLVTDPAPDPDGRAPFGGPPSRSGQAAELVRAVRAAASLPEGLTPLADGPVPPTPEAFEGTDHVVLAGNRLTADPAARLALRQWVERGGRLWVMLDLVDPEEVAPVLGGGRPVQVVDRVGLTTVRLHRPGAEPTGTGRQFEHPVELVRVIPAAGDRVLVAVNGWPAAFARSLGRGRVLFTAVGAAAWLPPAGAPPPGGRKPPGLPPAARAAADPTAEHVQELAGELHPRGLPQPLSPDALRPLLLDEVGYTVMGRGTAAGILGAFLAAVLGLGVGLRRCRRPELAGWLAPAAAATAAAVFVVLAGASRRGVPPTVATAAVAEAVPGTGELTVSGLFAAYQPESGPVTLAARRGGLLDLDPDGLEGQSRRRVQTDTDAWHLEGLSLPAGLRAGRFKSTARPGPVSAVARFGPDGVEGRLAAAGFGPPADGLIATPAGEPVAVRLRPDGGFAAGPGDTLAPGQFLAGAVLTDRQQRRQAVYRQLLGTPLPPHLDGRDLVMAWADASEAAFAAREGTRVVGATLLVVPLQFEPPPAGTRVTVPPAFVAVRRADGGGGRPTLESTYPVEMRLRFQLPASVLPLAVERATLHLRARAPSRRVSVGGLAGGRPVPLWAADSPADPVRVEVAAGPLLRPDGEGGLFLTLSVADAGPAAPEAPWRIDALGLEVVGRTAGGP